jgi:hypothetical protein
MARFENVATPVKVEQCPLYFHTKSVACIRCSKHAVLVLFNVCTSALTFL